MDLKTYFTEANGIGVLGTCDASFQPNLALYSKPVVIDNTSIALVMKQRHSHENIQQNLNAVYMFLENGNGYKGLRLYLTLQREEKNQSLIESLRKKQPSMFLEEDDSSKYLVFFTIDHIRPLIGDSVP